MATAPEAAILLAARPRRLLPGHTHWTYSGAEMDPSTYTAHMACNALPQPPLLPLAARAQPSLAYSPPPTHLLHFTNRFHFVLLVFKSFETTGTGLYFGLMARQEVSWWKVNELSMLKKNGTVNWACWKAEKMCWSKGRGSVHNFTDMVIRTKWSVQNYSKVVGYFDEHEHSFLFGAR
ncbi:hypothetical protein K438DRAFT_1765688 [Mycena galopus ATCC 62051]|nr:hypothetical protein K438DRAFT_1765688 [Mycena galopus ATCC 62051]